MKKILSIACFSIITVILLAMLEGRDGKPGCEESRSLQMRDGTIITCEDFCIDVQNQGRSLCPSRWHKAKSCDDIETIRLNCNVEYK